MENKIIVNGVTYVKEKNENEMDYKIVRTYSAGVFAGYVKSRNGREIELINARRIWYWEGAASLSQLAQEGTQKIDKCKFAIPANVLVLEAIEILEVSEKAKKIIEEAPVWKI